MDYTLDNIADFLGTYPETVCLFYSEMSKEEIKKDLEEFLDQESDTKIEELIDAIYNILTFKYSVYRK